MTTKALQIRDAVVALMTASAVAGVAAGSVYKDWPFHIKPEDVPAICVELGDEQGPVRFVIGALDRTLQLKVSIISKGALPATDATTAADAVVAEAHRRVVADLTLGGLAMDVTQDGINRRRDVLEVPVLITEMHYSVLYRTTNLSLEA